jgi:hypothetical protein
MSDSVVFSVVETFLSTFDVCCAYGSAHTFYHLNYMKLPVYYLSEVEFCKVWVRLGYVKLHETLS